MSKYLPPHKRNPGLPPTPQMTWQQELMAAKSPPMPPKPLHLRSSSAPSPPPPKRETINEDWRTKGKGWRSPIEQN